MFYTPKRYELLTIEKETRRHKLQVIGKTSKVKKPPKAKSTLLNCDKCSLCLTAKNPEFKLYGNKQSKIMIIGSYPDANCDITGVPYSGDQSGILRTQLMRHGIKLKSNTTVTFAAKCFSKKRSNTHAKCCRSKLIKDIQQINPQLIITLGIEAVSSVLNVYGEKLSINKMRGRIIPSHEFSCIVFPLFDIDDIYQLTKDDEGKWKRKINYANKQTFEWDVERIIRKWKKQFHKITEVHKLLSKRNILSNYSITQITTVEELKEVIKKLIQNGKFSFDYEASNAKPYDSYFEVFNVGFGLEKEAFVIYNSEFDDIPKAKTLIFELLQNEHVKKYIHMAKFEELCSRLWLNSPGRRVIKNSFCTLLASKVIDEREGCVSLDFVNLVRFGVPPYDDEIKKYLKKKKKDKEGNAIKRNTIHLAPKEKLIDYNGLDVITDYNQGVILEEILLPSNPNNKWCYELLFNADQAFANIQETGINIDQEELDAIDNQFIDLMDTLVKKTMELPSIKAFFDRDITIEEFKTFLRSPKQLQKYLYGFQKLKPIKKTKDGWSTDEEVIDEHAERDQEPLCMELVNFRKLNKAKSTYVDDIRRNIQEDGRVHASFNMYGTETYRPSGCISQGTMIDIVRDVSKYPNGIPIEQIKEGDLIYCFDDNLNPTISKVLWSGKTGFKKVIRVHWKGGKGRKGYLDLTPEHEIRLVNGKYVRSCDLLKKDHRSENESKYTPKCRTLSLSRNYDELFFTGKLTKSNRGILEHRFIYKQINELLTEKDIIHHKDDNHLNHSPSNLEKTIREDHTSLHTKKTNNTFKGKLRNKRIAKRNWEEGKFKSKFGKNNPNYLSLTKIQCIKELIKAKGKLTHIPYDFDTFKKYLKLYNINANNFKQKKIVNNHIITKVEEINKWVPVYDIHVEKHNNFFANEICVHNSDPNLLNQPKHDDIIEGIPWTIIRGVYIPTIEKILYPDTNDFIFAQVDMSGFELFIGAGLSGDKKFIKDVNETDMHAREAVRLYELPCDPLEVKKLKFIFDGKEFSGGKHLRFEAKNNAVFATVYGAVPNSIARNLRNSDSFMSFAKDKFALDKTTNLPFHQWVIGWSEEHVKHWQEDLFFADYPGLKEYQAGILDMYKQVGYVEYPMGFRRRHPLTRNEIINSPTQGTAWLKLIYHLHEIEMEMYKEIEKWRSRIVLSVYDDLLFDAYKPELFEVIDMVDRHTLSNPNIPQFEFAKELKFKNEWTFGYRMNNMKEINY